MDYRDKADQIYNSGFNCCQGVIGAFAEALHMDFQEVMALASGFGGGMGKSGEVCGAFSGLVMAVSKQYGYFSPAEEPEKKKEIYQIVTDYMERFKAEYAGCITCRALKAYTEEHQNDEKPGPTQPGSYGARPCTAFVRYAAGLAAERFQK